MVSSQVPYTMKAYWGVSIRELHLSLWRPWSVLEGQMQQGTILQDHYQHKGTSLQYPLSCVSGYINGKFWMNFLHALKRNETYTEGVTRPGTRDVNSSFSIVTNNQVKAVMVG